MELCKRSNMKQLLFTLLIFFLPGLSFSEQNKGITSESQKFYVLTIPKSGTHMVMKLITLLTGKEAEMGWRNFALNKEFCDLSHEGFTAVENAFHQWELSNRYFISHFYFPHNCSKFSQKHPEYIKIINIRDLRDAFISQVFNQRGELEKECGSADFNEQLMFVINLGDKPTTEKILRIERQAKFAVEWIKRPNIILSRFEDLVGEKGGGSLKAQEEQILKIANGLNISLSKEKLEIINQQLFGNKKGPSIESTFREGKIGYWKAYFNETHENAFKQRLGDLQLALGYTLD